MQSTQKKTELALGGRTYTPEVEETVHEVKCCENGP